MVQVHAVDGGAGWQLRVDGLRQEVGARTRAAVVDHGRRVAARLGGRLTVHDTDGRVVATLDYGSQRTPRVATPEDYLG